MIFHMRTKTAALQANCKQYFGQCSAGGFHFLFDENSCSVCVALEEFNACYFVDETEVDRYYNWLKLEPSGPPNNCRRSAKYLCPL